MKPGTTDATFYRPLTAPSGLPPTGLTYTDLDLRYTRETTPRTATVSTNLTVAASTTAVWVTSTVIEMDADTGLHRFDVPDAALAPGASRVIFSVCDPVGQTIIPINWEVSLDETVELNEDQVLATSALSIDAIFDALLTRLTAARAGYLDELNAPNIPADVDTLLTRLTALRAGYLDNLTELAAGNIPADVDTLLGRLTAARAGYIDELAPANIPANIATLLACCGGSSGTVDVLLTRLTAARAAYLDELAPTNIPADIDELLNRLTAARLGYLDELAPENIPEDIDTLLSRITGIIPTLAQILAANIDSTGAPVALSKAIEVILAYAIGNAEYDISTKRWVINGRDGTTPVAQITESSTGNRSGSTIP